MIKTTKVALLGLPGYMILGLVLALCQPAHAQQFVGQGQWESLSSGDFIRGTWSVTLQRSAAQLNGTMQITGSNVLKSASVSGTISGQNVVLGLTADGITEATFSGQLSGTSISGEWNCPAVGDQGVWRGTMSAQP